MTALFLASRVFYLKGLGYLWALMLSYGSSCVYLCEHQDNHIADLIEEDFS
ncbi:MAG: hypothetical protein PHX83_17115 [Acidobacteriia bacterium]|nr:hypothetical protein [Terriglobia bacterium]